MRQLCRQASLKFGLVLSCPWLRIVSTVSTIQYRFYHPISGTVAVLRFRSRRVGTEVWASCGSERVLVFYCVGTNYTSRVRQVSWNFTASLEALPNAHPKGPSLPISRGKVF